MKQAAIVAVEFSSVSCLCVMSVNQLFPWSAAGQGGVYSVVRNVSLFIMFD